MPQTAPTGHETPSGSAEALAEQNGSAAPRPQPPNAIPPGPAGRFWAGIGVAALVSLPFCWLLSFAALLPFFIGIFFFALFGLMIGAAVFRVASPRRPYRPAAVVSGTTVLVAFVWFASIFKESIDLPADMADKAAQRVANLRGVPVQQFRANVARDVRSFISARYPPGGVLGYIRWALDSGKFRKGDLASVEIPLALNQSRYIFAIRVVLSIGLLSFGIASQTWPLKQGRMADNRPSVGLG